MNDKNGDQKTSEEDEKFLDFDNFKQFYEVKFI
jgi:hypothetical protein